MSKEITTQDPKELAVQGNVLANAAGMSGFEDSDLPVPMVKLVTNRSDETLLQTGEPAPANKFYHTGLKEVVDPFIFRIIAVVKGESWSDRTNNGEGGYIKKIIFYGMNEETKEVFYMPISSSYAYWEFRNRVLPILNKALRDGHNIADVVLVGDRAVADNKNYGKITYPVFVLKEVKPMDDALRDYVQSVQSSFRQMAEENMDKSEDNASSEKEIDNVQLPA